MIALFWVVMMSALVYQEVIKPSTRRAAFAPPDFPQDLWMGVYMGEQRVGFFHTQSAPVMEDGVEGNRLRILAQLKLSLFSRETELYVNGSAFRPKEGEANFDFRLESGEQAMRVEGTAGGGQLRVRLHVADEIMPFSFPVSDDLIFSMGMDFPLQQATDLKPGDEVYVDTFDPVMMKVSRARIVAKDYETLVLSGEPVEALLLETSIGTFTTRAWVNDSGEVLQADTPLGLTLRKISPDEAVTALEGKQSGGDLVQRVAIVPEGLQPFEGARSMLIEMSGVDVETIPTGDAGQKREGAAFRIAPTPPVPGEKGEAENDSAALDGYLASDPFISADHPRILEQAREIVGDETDPWKQALLLNNWLFESIEKIPVISVPVALDVLRTLQGDCNEHAVLFTALARALEIPTRVAIGLVWSDELGAFGYHAWPEVFYFEDARWIPLDPTLGQSVADATHIKLLNGGVERWAQLLPFIGKLKIEVLEIE